MAYERSMNFKSALTSYDSGIALLDRLAISRTTPQGKTKIELFTKYRELWRWAERTLRGAAILSARARLVHLSRYLRTADSPRPPQFLDGNAPLSTAVFHLLIPLAFDV